MKTPSLIATLGALALFSTGCSPAQKTLSERDMKEAKALSSEAQFAMNLREWPRAEKLLLDAIKISPEAVFYHNLGSTRMRMGNRSGAKDAYQSAIDACDRMVAANPKNTDAMLKKVQLLALVGRVNDGRELAKKIEKNFPMDLAVRAFIDGKALDNMIASPTFKEISL